MSGRRLLPLLTGLLGIWLVAGCRSGPEAAARPSPPEVGQLVAEAGRRRASGDVEGARAALEAALRLAPDDAKALVALGRMQLMELGEPDAALATCQRAVRVAPEDAEARYGLGQQLHFQGQIDAARAEFREALRLRPGWPRAAAWVGATELDLPSGDLAAATWHLEAAVAADGRYPFARYQLGRAYGRTGRWKEAVDQLQEAVRLRPGYREAYYALGQALQRAGEREAARRALERFRALDLARREQRGRNVRRRALALE